jgi:putative ubiquitin-RnfH superfamily antitoxin RatB of RatAB toxin-antitoxin module
VSEVAIAVTVCFSGAARQCVEVALQMPAGSTLVDAIRQSQVLMDVPDADVDLLLAAVWGRKQAFNYPLRNGDRVELCRPLKVDPKMARRERFTKQGARSAGLFSKRRAGAKSGY